MKRNLLLTSLILFTLLPAMALGWRFLHDQLGANPVETLEHSSGDWALYLLLLTLAVPQLIKLLPKQPPLPTYLIKRTLGLAAFGYATLHLTVYFVFDLGLVFSDLIADLIERPFILVGMIAWLLLIPLAVTSTLNWQKRLKKRWFTLHKAIYWATGLGILHFFLLVKADMTQPTLLLIIFLALILWKRKII